MREIKFRAWHTVHKKMYEQKNIDVLLKNVNSDNIWKFMQFTGLKDKNGIAIYEGDMVSAAWVHHGEPGAPFKAFIFYNEHIGSFRIGYASLGGGAQDEIYFRYQVEVIGNVFENREWYDEIINNKAAI